MTGRTLLFFLWMTALAVCFSGAQDLIGPRDDWNTSRRKINENIITLSEDLSALTLAVPGVVRSVGDGRFLNEDGDTFEGDFFGGGYTLWDLGALEVTGTVTAGAFVGDASGLTNLPISAGTGGWLGSQGNETIHTGDVTVVSGVITGDGSGLSNVVASTIWSGSQGAEAIHTGDVTVVSGQISGDGSGLTNLPISAGTGGWLGSQGNETIHTGDVTVAGGSLFVSGSITTEQHIVAEKTISAGTGAIGTSATLNLDGGSNFGDGADIVFKEGGVEQARIGWDAGLNAIEYSGITYMTEQMFLSQTTLTVDEGAIWMYDDGTGLPLYMTNSLLGLLVVTENDFAGESAFTVTNQTETLLELDGVGDMEIPGDMTAGGFSGDGAGLTNVPSTVWTGSQGGLTEHTGNVSVVSGALSVDGTVNADTINTAGSALNIDSTLSGSSVVFDLDSATTDDIIQALANGDVLIDGNVDALSFTGDGSGLTSVPEDNDLSASVTWVNVPTQYIVEAAVTNWTQDSVESGDAAGGDLAGVYPNPTIATGAVGADELDAATDSSLALADSAVQPGDSAGGDLAGTYPSPTIAAGAVGADELDAATDASLALADTSLQPDHAADVDAHRILVAGNGITITTIGSTDTISLYEEPSIDSFTADQTVYEVGDTNLTTILSWSLSGATITTQEINQSTPALTVDQRSVTNTVAHQNNRVYTLTVTDDVTTNYSYRSVYFRYRRFWGYDASTELSDSGDILALESSELSTTGVKSTLTVSPGGEYFYYTYPEAWNEIDPYLDGFPVNNFVVTTNSFTNTYGNVSDYRIYRSPNTLVGDHTFEAQ